MDELPVAVIGAGPVGLAAAAQLIKRGATPVVLEAGASVGASVLEWGHVRIFSPWKYDIDPAARELLETNGWIAPDGESYPTGRELVEQYLVPLADTLAPFIRLRHRVRAIARLGFDKMKTEGRDDAPFAITVETPDGEQQLLARAVIDASGTYGIPNPLGASGVPARGEAALASRIHYGIPDPLGRDRATYAGKRVLVVGSGHSAFDALLELGELAELEGTKLTTITWLVRRPFAEAKYGGAENDALPARGALGTRMRALVDRGAVTQVVLRIAALRETGDGVFVSDGATEIGPFDRIVATTGFRPDLVPLRELRVTVDEILEAPPALAPLIDPNVHSCGTVPPHGVRELAHPEKDLYIVGMKSYGRAPTFLMLTGYEQVRSIACALTGDLAGAAAVELVLPETGVCGGGSDCCDGVDCSSPASTCCATSETAVIPLSALTAART
ncbi:MAG: NAD(P)-binding domain-containing protein, partial [Actinobacteria bacterium]|nr:NAD(P)-binding domain-containing protein [Actinomycetota bacterium]